MALAQRGWPVWCSHYCKFHFSELLRMLHGPTPLALHFNILNLIGFLLITIFFIRLFYIGKKIFQDIALKTEVFIRLIIEHNTVSR